MGITRRGLLRAGLALPALLAACGRETTTEDIQTSFFSFDTVCAIGGVMEQECSGLLKSFFRNKR